MIENLKEQKAYEIYKKAQEALDEKNLEEALSYFKMARQICYETYSDIHESVLKCYINEADIYKTMQRVDVAYVIFKLAILIGKKVDYEGLDELVGEFTELRNQLFTIIEKNSKTDNYDLLEYFENLLKVSKLESYEDDAYLCYSLLAKISDRENNKELAIEYLRLAILNLQYYESLNRKEIADNYDYMGNMYTQLGQLDKALACYDEESVYLKSLYREDSEEYNKSNLAKLRTYIYAHDYVQANKLESIILNLIEEKYLNSLNSLNMLLEIADTYFDVKLYEAALKSYNMAIKCAKTVFTNDPDQIKMLYDLIKKKFEKEKLVDYINKVK